MKYIKLMMIVIVIIIVVIIGLIGILMSKNNENTMNQNEEFYEDEIEIEYEPNEQISLVNNKNTYYAVKDILTRYLQYNSDIKNSKDKEISIKAISDMLDINYKNESNITDKKIETLSKNYDTANGIYIEKMYELEKSSRINIYYIYGKCNKIDYKIIIKTDSYNNSFSIFPEEYIVENEYNESNIDSNIKIDGKDIEIKENNTFKYKNISNKDMAINYFNDYIQIINNNIEKAYEMLDEEYKLKRFATIKEYTDYIKTIVVGKETAVVNVSKENENIVYECKNMNNKYIFIEESFMNYKVRLDDYTIDSKAFNEKYNEVNNRDKGILNIDKFFKMINMKDYTSAYNVLDESFKSNNFKTQSDFENYIKNKVFNYNKVSYKEYNNQITGIHTYKVILTDATEASNKQVEFNIVMQLKEGTDFVMSFSID